LQAGRYLVNCYRDAKEGKKLPPGVGYLNNIDAMMRKKCQAKNKAEVASLSVIAEATDVVNANIVKKLGEDFQACLGRGLSHDEAYEDTGEFR
jgi:acyl-CoA oxidase